MKKIRSSVSSRTVNLRTYKGKAYAESNVINIKSRVSELDY